MRCCLGRHPVKYVERARDSAFTDVASKSLREAQGSECSHGLSWKKPGHSTSTIFCMRDGFLSSLQKSTHYAREKTRVAKDLEQMFRKESMKKERLLKKQSSQGQSTGQPLSPPDSGISGANSLKRKRLRSSSE